MSFSRNGQRRCFVDVQQPTPVKQANASIKVTWATFHKLWASIETLKGYDKQAACSTWPGSDSKITIRYVEGLLPTMRIVFNSVVYSILNINNVNMRNRELVITCQSGVKAQ